MPFNPSISGYLVVREGRDLGVYSTLEEAKKEAEKLCKKEKCGFEVVFIKSVAKCSHQILVNWCSASKIDE